ncbi:acetyl-CoA carboxylase biotin carboxyl carrier protein [Tuwongella immobilis]|uniref:Biotin carboxyl carrier protein of acetyl-CoA carboxylase n=1 Tax=Tuwongella immobilis TaxID=692036 RepID=A0A6C2YT85_9BACT|nr:acetyl-CoA carboxylase biotin carboxyl carrier protein [Tuwongella immobilis]VIP04948.1 acetyl- carboxylase biotin carboxyl carrier protein : Biotin carboxyl carrier protein OS=Bacillus azotoformans MEV2011 GN=M670_03447 PE=4 SV=1: Biotin_lipoyl [Tuwongella immobilis]VTS07254.1 acetyl- carboxylase biotin carboxyl carrier protein : Biotin carboxyl carrier protein OS=Bacillus azotoformans MEV2011 GN=M670_03447 PE=4 SV=1: Biotin_lipoyl [Tuwongella immobilis]
MASDELPETPRPFDVETLRYLIRLMSRHELSEIALQEGDRRIRLRRGGGGGAAAPMGLPPGLLQQLAAAAAAPAPAGAAPTAAAAPAQAAAPAAPAKKLFEIKSPTPGTFYSKPKPDADDFVKVGSKIKPDTVVCLVEAMKLFNDIKAECTGTIAEVCVQNAQSVEYGTVLYRVELS